ncbi:EpsG family protein [Phocaeicola sartorii]|uniref:EpsG family protein n=1 Tax=Phocaeicola sartorii TaxID=671267 RepID=UPI003512394D
MFFYLFIFSVCIFLGFFADCTNKRASGVATLCITFLLSYIGGVRNLGIGTDTLVYTENYFWEAVHLDSWKDFFEASHDKGYMLLNYMAVLCNKKVWMAQFVIQFFTHGLIFMTAFKIKHLCRFKMTLFTILYCCVFYNQSYNFMRQYCALALLMWGLYYALDKRWYIYILCQFGAFFFHSSSLLFLLVPFLYHLCTQYYGSKWRCVIVGGAIISLIVATTCFYEVLDLLNTIEVVSDTHANRYAEGDDFGARSGVRKSLVLLIVCIFYFCYVSHKRIIGVRGLPLFVFSLNVFFMAFYALSFYSVYLYRLALYFYMPLMLFVTLVVSSRKILNAERAVWVMLLLLDWLLYVVKNNGAESFPYHSKILGI